MKKGINLILENVSVLVTKSEKEAKHSLSRLINEGADLIFFPTIKIKPIYTKDDFTDLIVEPHQFDYIIFTSANAVEVFSGIISEYKLDLSKTKIAVVGKVTAEECRSRGLYIHLIPEEYSAKGLIKKFSEIGIYNKKILIPGSALSREDLKIGLTELGAKVVSIPIYDVVTNDISELKNDYEKILAKKPNVFIFTSPSSFENYLKLLNINQPEVYFEKTVVCAIGPTTEFEIESCNVKVNIVPKIYSLEGLADAILEYFNLSKNIA
ncbi:MAG: uroporphyrinogen-III synthase [Melioribacter sp.]|nr:uroporphyrinogen-III synthase [Melioribacter sp.]